MNRELSTAGERPPAREDDRTSLEGSTGFGWRRLQVVAALGLVGSLLLPMFIQLSFEPFLLAMAAPFIVGLLLIFQWPRFAAMWLGVCSLAVLLFSAPFLAEALAHPESMADFIPLFIFTVSTLVGIVATIPSFRQGRRRDAGSEPARAIAVGAGALIVAAVVASIVTAAGIESVPAQASDIRVVTEEFEFHPAGIAAETGSISLHVTNRDATRHTFTIDELGVDLNLPPHSTQRVTFVADQGIYRFYCRPHAPDMEGEFVVR